MDVPLHPWFPPTGTRRSPAPPVRGFFMRAPTEAEAPSLDNEFQGLTYRPVTGSLPSLVPPKRNRRSLVLGPSRRGFSMRAPAEADVLPRILAATRVSIVEVV
jgi:hypothetical protein